jgi:hypothetical protein
MQEPSYPLLLALVNSPGALQSTGFRELFVPLSETVHITPYPVAPQLVLSQLQGYLRQLLAAAEANPEIRGISGERFSIEIFVRAHVKHDKQLHRFVRRVKWRTIVAEVLGVRIRFGRTEVAADQLAHFERC